MYKSAGVVSKWLHLTRTAGCKSDCKSPLVCLGNDLSSLCDMKTYSAIKSFGWLQFGGESNLFMSLVWTASACHFIGAKSLPLLWYRLMEVVQTITDMYIIQLHSCPFKGWLITRQTVKYRSQLVANIFCANDISIFPSFK